MSWSLRRHRRTPRSGERGAVAIEAALIFPVVLMLGVGIIEWSLVLRDQIELTSLARAGARAASSLAPDPTAAAHGVPFSEQVVASMTQATAALPQGSVQYAVVYEPGTAGLAGDSSAIGFDCGSASACARYDWDASLNGGQGGFVAASGAWDASGINACLGSSNMSDVGVYVRADHAMLTGLFGSTRGLSAFTVMRFDPQRPGRCSG